MALTETRPEDLAAKFSETVESLLVSSASFLGRLKETVVHTVFRPGVMVDQIGETSSRQYVRPFTYLAIGAFCQIVCYENLNIYSALFGDSSLVAAFEDWGNNLTPWQIVTQTLPVVASLLLALYALTFTFFKSEKRGIHGEAFKLLCYCVGTQMMLLFGIVILIAVYAVGVKLLVAFGSSYLGKIDLGAASLNRDSYSWLVFALQCVAAASPLPTLYVYFLRTRGRSFAALAGVTIAGVLYLAALLGANVHHSFADAKRIAATSLYVLLEPISKPNATPVRGSVKLIGDTLRFKLFVYNEHEFPLTLVPKPKLVSLSCRESNSIAQRGMDCQFSIPESANSDDTLLRIGPRDTIWMNVEISLTSKIAGKIEWPLNFVIVFPQTNGTKHYATGIIEKPAS
ncbi:hypothetical protein OAG68_01325 [bacterium]|nr:hypothetical protein [bacterium]